MMKIFKNEISWDGVLALVTIFGMVVGGTIYCVETRSTATQAGIAAVEAKQEADAAAKALVSAAAKLAAQQSHDEVASQKHLEKLDAAVEMIAIVLSERTGKPVSFPPLGDPSDTQSSPTSNDPP